MLNDWILTYLFQLLSLVVSQSLERAAAGDHIVLLGELLEAVMASEGRVTATPHLKYEQIEGKEDAKATVAEK